MTMKEPDDLPQSHKSGPIDLDTCEPWEEENKPEQEQTVEDEGKTMPVLPTTTTTMQKSTKTSSQPFGSALKQFIKVTAGTYKRLSRSASKKQDGNITDSDMSMSSTGTPTTFDQENHNDSENDPPMSHYKDHARSPLLKNMDTSLYDNRLLSSIVCMMEQQQKQQQDDDISQLRSKQTPFRQYLPFDDYAVVVL